MPSPSPATAVKLVTVGGEPRVQGVCVVFDSATLAPAAVVDGIALTNLRTAAVSAWPCGGWRRPTLGRSWSSGAGRRRAP